MTTVASMNASDEPRIVAASVSVRAFPYPASAMRGAGYVQPRLPQPLPNPPNRCPALVFSGCLALPGPSFVPSPFRVKFREPANEGWINRTLPFHTQGAAVGRAPMRRELQPTTDTEAG